MLVLPPLVVKSLKANHTYGIFLLFANLQQKKNTKIKQIKQPHAASFCCLPICNQKKEYKNKTTTCGIFSLFANLQPKMKQIKQIKQMKQPHVASFSKVQLAGRDLQQVLCILKHTNVLKLPQ